MLPQVPLLTKAGTAPERNDNIPGQQAPFPLFLQ